MRLRQLGGGSEEFARKFNTNGCITHKAITIRAPRVPLPWVGDNAASCEDIMPQARASGETANRRAKGNPRSRTERASHYRHYAAQFRILAEDEPSRARRAKLARLARHYAELAARAGTTP